MAADAVFYRKGDWSRFHYLDWRNFAEFQGATPQTIASVTVDPVTGLTFANTGILGTLTYWQTTGGTAGQSYLTTVHIVTSAGVDLSADVLFVTNT